LKLVLPLYGRIAGWFLLNLVLVCLIVYGFTHSLFPADGQLSSSAAKSVNTLANLVGSRLQYLDETEWPAELKSLEEEHEFEFQPYTINGRNPRGLSYETPPDVLFELNKFTMGAKLAKKRVKPRVRPRSIRRPPPALKKSPAEPSPSRVRQSPPPYLLRPLEDRIIETPDSGFSDLKVQSLVSYKDKSEHYWFLAQISLGPPTHVGYRRPHAVLLLMKASDKTAKSIVFDSKPWWLLGLCIFVLCLIMWLPFTWKLTHYIAQLTGRTEMIAKGHFKINNSPRRYDELGRLGSAIDQLAQRLDGFVNGQQRFMSDIAHELCGPLVRMQLSLGVIELSPEKTGEKLTGLRLEIDEMSKMVEELLDFSRASLSPEHVELETINLHELVNSAFAKECAPHQKNEVSSYLTVQGNKHLLIRAIGNIIRNSICYAGVNEVITISAETSKHQVILHIDDKGPGIPEEHLTKIFDPFYRADEARTREEGGTGLGLAIVQTCVRACKGDVSCMNLQPHGLRVSFVLNSKII